jgi:hypothetical protein
MRRVLLGLLFTFIACASRHDYAAMATFSLRPGQQLPSTGTHICSSHKGRTLCAEEITHRGIRFNVDIPGDLAAVDDSDRLRILYVQTFDPKFLTDEHLAVGIPIAKALEFPGARSLTSGCGVSLPSGWFAYCDDSEPPRISYFDSGH